MLHITEHHSLLCLVQWMCCVKPLSVPNPVYPHPTLTTSPHHTHHPAYSLKQTAIEAAAPLKVKSISACTLKAPKRSLTQATMAAFVSGAVISTWLLILPYLLSSMKKSINNHLRYINISYSTAWLVEMKSAAITTTAYFRPGRRLCHKRLYIYCLRARRPEAPGAAAL